MDLTYYKMFPSCDGCLLQITHRASMPKATPSVILFLIILNIVAKSQLSTATNVTNTTHIMLLPTSSFAALSTENVTSVLPRPSITSGAGMNSISIPLTSTAVVSSTRTLAPTTPSTPAANTESNKDEEKRTKGREEDEKLYLIIASSTGAAILFLGIIVVLCSHWRTVRQRVDYNIEY